MTNEIRPALSAEEWRHGYAKRALRVTTGVQGCITVAGELGGAGTRDPATLHAIIAIANASLPDNDPRKLTWEDVRACRDDLNHYVEDREEMLRTLAAKIAALLPPREEG